MTCYQCNQPGQLIRKRLTPSGILWLIYGCPHCTFSYLSFFGGKKTAHPTWMVPQS